MILAHNKNVVFCPIFFHESKYSYIVSSTWIIDHFIGPLSLCALEGRYQHGLTMHGSGHLHNLIIYRSPIVDYSDRNESWFWTNRTPICGNFVSFYCFIRFDRLLLRIPRYRRGTHNSAIQQIIIDTILLLLCWHCYWSGDLLPWESWLICPTRETYSSRIVNIYVCYFIDDSLWGRTLGWKELPSAAKHRCWSIQQGI